MSKSYFYKYSKNGVVFCEVAYESGIKHLIKERNRLCKKYDIKTTEMPIWSCDDFNPFSNVQENVKVFA